MRAATLLIVTTVLIALVLATNIITINEITHTLSKVSTSDLKDLTREMTLIKHIPVLKINTIEATVNREGRVSQLDIWVSE